MASLSGLLGKLEVYSKTDSHRQVYDTAKLILSKDGSNIQALKRSLVALINMDNYKDAEKLIQQYSKLVETNKTYLVLELAYIYYKLDSTKEDDLTSLSDFITASNSRAFNHILAQYYYRIGEDIKALEIYKILINEKSDDESENLDLSVNERAVISQLKFQNNFNYELNNLTNPISFSYSDSYDQLFNDSLILIIDKKYNEAIDLLNKTYDLAENSLSDYEQHEKFIELGPIKLQLAYVNILLSKYETANSLLDDLNNQLKNLSNGTNDINVKILNLLIQINKLVCIENLESLDNVEAALLYRELDFNDTIDISKQRLTIPQLLIIERNHLLLSFFSGKKSKDLIKSFNEKFSFSLLPNAITFNNDIKENLLTNKKYFYNLSIKNPSNISLCLLASQIAINANNYQRAISILENSVNYNENILLLPSIGKLLYSLYESLDCKNLINKLLIKIANLLIKKTSLFNNEDIKYAKFVALKLISTDELLAKELLSKINELNILDVKYSSDDITRLTSNVDVNKLVENGIGSLIKVIPTSTVNTGKITKEKRKRSKPRKLPKVITSQQIDEERWLPMKDRSYYKMKKSKKNKNTQGGAIDAATEKALNINSTPEPVTSSNNNNSSSSKKNKKKKGKK